MLVVNTFSPNRNQTPCFNPSACALARERRRRRPKNASPHGRERFDERALLSCLSYSELLELTPPPGWINFPRPVEIREFWRLRAGYQGVLRSPKPGPEEPHPSKPPEHLCTTLPAPSKCFFDGEDQLQSRQNGFCPSPQGVSVKISGPFGAANFNSHALWGRAKCQENLGSRYGATEFKEWRAFGAPSARLRLAAPC